MKVPAQDNTLTIRVGANDGETIDIDLKQINSQTLGLDTLNVQKAYDVDSKAVTGVSTLDTTGLTGANIKTGVDGATTTSGSIKDGKVYYDGATKNYYVEVDFSDAADTAKNGYYKVNVADDGTVTMGASTTKETAKPAGVVEVTKTQEEKAIKASAEVKAALTAGGVDAADAATAEMVKMSYTDKNGKTIDGGYAVKVGDSYYAATQKKMVVSVLILLLTLIKTATLNLH